MHILGGQDLADQPSLEPCRRVHGQAVPRLRFRCRDQDDYALPDGECRRDEPLHPRARPLSDVTAPILIQPTVQRRQGQSDIADRSINHERVDARILRRRNTAVGCERAYMTAC